MRDPALASLFFLSIVSDLSTLHCHEVLIVPGQPQQGDSAFQFPLLGYRETGPLCHPHRDAVKTNGLSMRNDFFPIKCKVVSREKAVGWEPGPVDLCPGFL